MRKRSVLLVLLAVVSLIACNEENSQVAGDLFKGDMANVVVSDPVSISGIVEKDNNAAIDKVSSFFLGKLSDSDFGTTSAGAAFQLGINSNVFIKDRFAVDSVNLDFKVNLNKSVYDSIRNKDFMADQSLEVFYLEQAISDVHNRAQFTAPLNASTSLGTATVNYLKPDTLTYKSRYFGGTGNQDFKFAGVMHMKLNKAFGEKLLTSNEADYVSKEAFLKLINGLAIRPAANCPSTGLFNITPNSIIVTVHYTKKSTTDETKRDTLFVPFPVSTSSAILALFDNSLTPAIETKIANKESDKLFVLGGAGLRSVLTLPAAMLDTMYMAASGDASKNNKLINRALLSLPVIMPKDASGNDLSVKTANLPEKLVMVGFNSDGAIVPLAGYPTAFFGGEFDSTAKVYNFNIAQLLQYVVNNTKESFNSNTKIDISKGFAIYPDNRRENPRRVVLDGSKMKLAITYTKL